MNYLLGHHIAVILTFFLFLICQVPPGFRGFAQVLPFPWCSLHLTVPYLLCKSVSHVIALSPLRPSLSRGFLL